MTGSLIHVVSHSLTGSLGLVCVVEERFPHVERPRDLDLGVAQGHFHSILLAKQVAKSAAVQEVRK